MEQFVLGIFQEQLSKFIVGFRKEQVNANLLNGKGEISNVELNCAALNEILTKMTPYIELEHVHVSKVSFHVSSWRNLRKAPIMIDIEHVRARAVEPLRYWDRTKRKPVQQLLQSDLQRMIAEGLLPKPSTGPYNIFDRILDNLTIEISTVTLEFQPWGKFKTKREGPWQPPELQLKLADIQLISVNEFGHEAPPNEIWRHNHHHKTFLIYKRLRMEYQVLLRPVGAKQAIPLVTGGDNVMEVQLAMKRRVRDGAWLAVQIDASIPRLEVILASEHIPLLVQSLAGIAFCLTKDRTFEDPLQPTSHKGRTDTAASNVEVVLTKSAEHANEGDMAEEIHTIDIIPDELKEDSSSSEDEDEESGKPASDIETASTSTNQATISSLKDPLKPSEVKDFPILLLPNGLVIHEKVSFSLSIHHAKLRGTYADGGCVEADTSGCIVELIWPKVTREKGGYAQASVAYVSVHEQYGNKRRPIVVGGSRYDSSGSMENPSVPLSTVGRDETFPLYEDRCVRPDPLGLRHAFPAQAVGFKLTVDFVERLTSETDSSSVTDMMCLNEIGIDQFEVIADAPAWCRVVCFALNTNGGGFDQRIFSGDWSKHITTDILVHPEETLVLENHLQLSKAVFLDENEFISSDLFNVTARVTKGGIRFPGVLEEDIQSCDIIGAVEEATLVVSSALPRTFFSGKIGSLFQEKDPIRFPNDKSDIGFVLLDSEDPSDRQRGVMTSQSISTFRVQLTLKNYSLRLRTVIPPAHPADEPGQLMAPSELTLLLCFEGRPPDMASENSVKVALFLSALIHRFIVNVDPDLLASAVGTFTYHLASVVDTSTKISAVLSSLEHSESEPSEYDAVITDGNEATRFRRSLRGRRALVRKQLRQSRESGVLSVTFAAKVIESTVQLWRQNLPPNETVWETSHKHAKAHHNVKTPAILRILSTEAESVEFGSDAMFVDNKRRVIVKCTISSLSMKVCDFSPVSADGAQPNRLIEAFSLGYDENRRGALVIRADNISTESHCLSLSMDIRNGILKNYVKNFEKSFALVVEAFLMPTAAVNSLSLPCGDRLPPGRTVGELLLSVARDVTGFDWLFSRRTEQAVVTSLPDSIPCGFISEIPFAAIYVTVADSVVEFPVSNQKRYAGLMVKYAKLLYSHSHENTKGDKLLDIVATADDIRWSSLLDADRVGTWLRLESAHSLLMIDQIEERNDMAPLRTEVSKTFRTEVTLEPDGKVASTTYDVSLANLLGCFSGFRGFISEASKSTRRSINLMRSLRTVSNQSENGIESTTLTHQTPETAPVLALITELKRCTGRVLTYADAELSNEQNLFDALKEQLFEKERERIGALGIVSVQAAGWLRMGAAQRSGQRGLLSCTLWPYWVVLRNQMLIIYKKPGSYQPTLIIPTKNASLKEIIGGRKKRDLKRAFALEDIAGGVSFFVAATDREFFDWVSRLQRIVLSTSTTYHESQSNRDSSGSAGGDFEEFDERSVGGRSMGKSITKAFIAAKATGRAVVERAGRRKGDDSGLSNQVADSSISEISSGTEDSDIPGGSLSRRRQIRNKFAGVGQVTKRRFGSALSAAKEKGKQVALKGKEVAEKRRAMRSERAADDTIDDDIGVLQSHSCPQCTFANPTGSLSCLMCQYSFSGSTLSVTTAEVTSVELPEATDGSGISQRNKSTTNTTVSERIGNAVRNVRGRNAGEEEDEISSSSVFNLRNRNAPDSQETQEEIHLRNVSLAGPLSIPAAPFELDSGPTEKVDMVVLHHEWIVQVAANSAAIVPNVYLDSEPSSHDTAQTDSNAADVATIDLEPIEKDCNNEDTQQNAPRPMFILRLVSRRAEEGGSEQDRSKQSEVQRTFGEVLDVHRQISEEVGSLVHVAGADHQMAETLETLRFTGGILSSLLAGNGCSLPTEEQVRFVKEFFNSTFHCPLPRSVVSTLSDFFATSYLDTTVEELSPPTDLVGKGQLRRKFPAMFKELTSLIHSCQTAVLRAQSRSLTISSQSVDRETTCRAPAIVHRAHDTMHAALLQVMEERDEAHMRMVAADVLHVHEIEQQRKKTTLLQDELSALKTRTGESREMGTINDNQRPPPRHNTDEELISLCQQLATEITGKASASLEATRLQEIRQIEKEHEREQREKLQSEVEALSNLLAAEKRKSEASSKEAGYWREMFSKLDSPGALVKTESSNDSDFQG